MCYWANEASPTLGCSIEISRDWASAASPTLGGSIEILRDIYIIGERAKRAKHSQVCSIENRGYILYIYIVRANFVLITRKEGGA